MRTEPAQSYRARIYGSYVTARSEELAPADVGGLKPRLPYLHQLVRRRFPADRDSAILELGCGHGALLYALQQAGYKNCRGVDGSTEQVAAARRLGISGVVEGDVMAALAASADASLDVVVAFDLIEHFTKQELIPLIDEVWRVLKLGGRWIIHAPNAESPFGARMRLWDFTHEQAFTRTSLDQILRASGFTQVACFEDRPVIHGVTSALRAGLWTCLRWGLLFYLAVETGALNRRVFVTRHGKRIAALVSAEDAELLDAIEDRLDLEAVRKARRDIASHGTVPLIRLVKELGL